MSSAGSKVTFVRCDWWISTHFVRYCFSRPLVADLADVYAFLNYDWRQWRTQIFSWVLNFRVRMLLKGAEKCCDYYSVLFEFLDFSNWTLSIKNCSRNSKMWIPQNSKTPAHCTVTQNASWKLWRMLWPHWTMLLALLAIWRNWAEGTSPAHWSQFISMSVRDTQEGPNGVNLTSPLCALLRIRPPYFHINLLYLLSWKVCLVSVMIFFLRGWDINPSPNPQPGGPGVAIRPPCEQSSLTPPKSRKRDCGNHVISLKSP